MRKKRIDGALASIPVQNGQVLKGEHLAILREVLSAAINENKYDIDRIISADPDAIHVYGEDSNALDEYTASNEVLDGVLGYVHTSHGVGIYEYNEGTESWEYLGELSLVELFNKVRELDAHAVKINENGDVWFDGILNASIFSGDIFTEYISSDSDFINIGGGVSEVQINAEKFAVKGASEGILLEGSPVVDISGAKVTNLGTPTDATDAATKEYVDGLVDLNSMAYFNYAGGIYGAKYNLLASAWESSLVVDPLEIMAISSISNQRGTAQYPNGQTEGVVIPYGVTSIGNNAFRNWESNNQPLVIPSSVTSIGQSAFRRWVLNNHPLVIPNSVTSIGDNAFFDWPENNHPIVIPASVTSIGDGAFDNWSLVPYVEMKGTTPPTLGDAFVFYRQNDAPIYVPDASVAAYKAATNWVDLADRIFSINDKS